MPIDVVISRPKLSAGKAIGALLGFFLANLVAIWIIMLLLPLAFDVDPGFWQTTAGYLVIRLLRHDRNYLVWTRRAS